MYIIGRYMKKLFLGVLFALVFSINAIAEVEIPEDKRVKNFDSGCCVWCAIEDLGNVHGISELKGLAKYRHEKYGKKKVWVEALYTYDPWGNLVMIQGPHWSHTNEAPGTYDRVCHELDRLKVKYKIQDHWNCDPAILEEAVDKCLGCAVALRDYPAPGNNHMVTLTDINDKNFVFVDNNGKCGRFVRTRQWFNQHWTGFTVIVYPKRPMTAELREPVDGK
jgi:hypothetical protein